MSTTLSTNACTVRATDVGFGVFALESLAAGSRLIEFSGSIRREPTRYSIQIALDEHVDCTEPLDPEEMQRRHPWRFLNHSCDPNGSIVGRTLVARRAIRAGEQVTFDYTTTEARMAEPFECRCGARACLGSVRGFLLLSPAQQLARADIVAPHLKSFLPRTVATTAWQDLRPAE